MKKVTAILFALLCATTVIAQPKLSWEEATAKANEMLSKLSLEEKIEMTHGYNKFFLPGQPHHCGLSHTPRSGSGRRCQIPKHRRGQHCGQGAQRPLYGRY